LSVPEIPPLELPNLCSDAVIPAAPREHRIFRRLAARHIIPATSKPEGPRLAFDIESDGLLDTATKIHCIVVVDLDSDQVVDEFDPDRIEAGLARLSEARYLTGHNICGFDLPLLRKLYGWEPAPDCIVVDTLIAGRLILPHIRDLDQQAAAMGDPPLGKLAGRYSLEAWGARLGMPKVGTDIEVWAEWTPEMQARCVSDVRLTKALWQFLQPDGQPSEALALEHRVSAICDEITAAGIPFDREAAKQLRDRWIERRTALEARLRAQFPEITNWNSRAQIAALLEARGWRPDKRTEKTKRPVIDDELLETLPRLYPELDGLAEHYILGRRLGQLSEGKQAWIGSAGNDGHIHGGIVHIGTPHSRATHRAPNLAQVPNPKKGKLFTAECRALFRADAGWVFVASDQAGLQDRGFAHYLAEFDGGAYARTFSDGTDTHWKSSIALGLIPAGTERDKASVVHTAIREGAKRFRYAFLFGAGNARAGIIIAETVRDVQRLDPNSMLRPLSGPVARQRFMDSVPGLAQLRRKLNAAHARSQWVAGLDGRRVPTGAQYKALNRIVTSSEAIICKRWLVNVRDELGRGFAYGWDGDVVLVAWVHDELVACCRAEIADAVGAIMVKHAKEAGESYQFKVPLDADYKIGRSWAGDPADNKSNDTAPAVTTDLGIGSGPNVEPVAAEADNPAPTQRQHPQSDERGDKICCPYHADRTPSLQIYPDGHFHCFGCGAHGSIEELPDADGVLPDAAPDGVSTTSTNKLKSALRLWQSAKPISGTLAERYLIETRKLDLAGIPALDDVLRFHPRCVFDDVKHPCLIALFRDVATDEPAGIHRIALTADAQKIARMMLGPWPHSRAIKLRATGTELLVGEGIETTLAGMTVLAQTECALWAMGSANAIGQLPLVPDMTTLRILVDHDDNAIGISNARLCATRWCRGGRRHVHLLRTEQSDSDFNDLIKART
jgi:DNA polymerase I-like protein with 3'-5' exonuclease and polymerase domains